MKKKEIPALIVIGHKKGEYGTYEPVMVLDTSTLWAERWNGGFANGATFSKSSDNRYSNTRQYSFGVETGYLCLKTSHRVTYHETDRNTAIEAMRKVASELPKELTPDYVKFLKSNLPENVELDILNNRWFEGPTWEEVERKRKWKAEAAREATELRRKREERNAEWLANIREAAEERNVFGLIQAESDGRVSMSLATIAALLGVEEPQD